MKIKGKLIILSIIIFVAISTLVFFISSNSGIINNENQNSNLQNEKINILMIEPDHFLSIVSNNKYVHEVCNLVFEGLTEDDEALRSQPKLAKLIVTENNLKWDIKLRDDVYFHNGDKFTSKDVAFTINKIKELGESSYFSYNVENIKNIKISSDYDITLELEEYDNFLPEKLNFPMLSKVYYENSDFFTEDRYIGTGPYEMYSKSDELISLKYNDDYYLESKGNIKDIDVKIIPKTRPGFDLLKLGEIDIADTNTEVGAYGRSAYNSSKYVTSVFEGIIFNSDNEILKDNIIKQAMLLGINRDYIIEKELNGYGVYSDVPINPDSYLYNSSLKKYAFNPEKAQDLLTNSGWSGNIRSKSGQNLEFNLLINSDAKSSLSKAESIKNDLAKIGVKINIIVKTSQEYNDAVENKDYDLVIVDWAITDYPEFLYNFESSSKNNVFGFKNEDYDYLVYLAKREILDGKTKDYFYKMQEILYRELPVMGLYFETSTVFYNKEFNEELTPKLNNIYYKLNDCIFNEIEE